MAMNDPYGLLASGLPPDMAAQAMGLSRQEAVLQAILQQAQQTPQAPETKGRFQGRISPLAPLAQALGVLGATHGMGDIDKKYADLAGRSRSAVADAMTNYQRTRDGVPAQSIPPLTPNDDEGNPMPAAVKPGVPGDRRTAVMQAMLNPMLARNPLVEADLKKIEPEWTPTKQYNPTTGREERVLVNKNDPSQVMPMGGQKAPEMKPVTTIDPVTKQPVTKFVNPNTTTEAIPQPVKQEMVNAGGAVIPVNPYTPTVVDKTVSPDAQLHANVTERGQNMTDARTRELNGILQNGGSNDQIESMATMIANGQLAPPTGFALRNPMMIRIMSRAHEINPEFSAIDFHVADKAAKDFSTGKPGNTVRSFNVALNHLDTLEQAADALHNGDTPLLNKVGNSIAYQTGQPAPSNFEGVKKIVGDEIVKAIVGSGGGVSDREAAAKTIDAANSPAQLKGVIAQYKTLMGGQLSGLRQQYESSTGRKDFDKFLSEAAQATKGAAPKPGSSNVLRFDAQGNQLP